MFRHTVAWVPSDGVEVAVAIMEEEFVLGPFGSALKQIHGVMAVDHPAVPQKHAARCQTSNRGTLETFDKVDQVVSLNANHP